MSTLALSWFEDEDPRDLARWGIAAAIVLGIHAAAIAGYLLWHTPEEDLGDDAPTVTVELAPSDSDVDQAEVAPEPEVQQKPVEQPPPPDVSTDVAVLPEQKPVEEQKPPPPPPMPARTKGGAPHIESSWQSSLVHHLQHYKRYPSDALQRAEEGIVLLGFSLDRNGHVLAHRIVKSSGYTDLDDEVMAMIIRAEPLPPFPANMPEPRIDLTVPIRFSMH